jgi:hypothetical protein
MLGFFDILTDEDSSDDNGTEAELGYVFASIGDLLYMNIPPVTNGMKRARVKADCHVLLTYKNQLGTQGILYNYGQWSPDGDIFELKEAGADCSGSVLTIAIDCRIIGRDFAEKYRSVASLRPQLALVNSPKIGDVAFYGDTHAAIVCYVSNGVPWVMSMSGGGQSTHSDDADARAKLVRADYWSAFTEIRRFPGM